ncbi:MAG: hypothetical protein ACKOOL_02910 [Novosphingobium sp.]
MSPLPVLTAPEPDPQTPPDPSLFSRERQALFLEALAATGQVRVAAARAGVSHQTAYRARLASPGLRRAWDAALLAARAQAEEMLACRALEGWEEDVVYHGEVVATRRRWSDRLLLAHLARLDRLCADAEVAEFADAFEDNLGRYAAGEDRPARAPEPQVVEAEVAAPDGGVDNSSPGQWSKRSTPALRQAEGERDLEPCPDCGGACLGPERALTSADCMWLGNRLNRMDAARPAGARQPFQFPDGDRDGAIEEAQLAAFEAGVERWWLVVPPPAGTDPAALHYLDEKDW